MQTMTGDHLLTDLLASVMPPGRPQEGGGDEAPPEGDGAEEETEPT
jgi:hypothetical protein